MKLTPVVDALLLMSPRQAASSLDFMVAEPPSQEDLRSSFEGLLNLALTRGCVMPASCGLGPDVTGVVESVIRWIRFQQVSELLTEVTSVRVRSYCLHFVMRRFMGLNVSRVIGYGSPWPRWQFFSVTPRVCRSRSKFVVAVGESRDVDRADVRQWRPVRSGC